MGNTKLTYTEKDGLFYPNYIVQEDYIPMYKVGKYGNMALAYMEEEQPGSAEQLKMEGTLTKILYELNEEAMEMRMLLEDQLLEKYPIPDQDDHMRTVQHRSWIRNTAEEIVLNDLIYQRR